MPQGKLPHFEKQELCHMTQLTKFFMAYAALYKNQLYFYLKKYFYKPQSLRLTPAIPNS
jgi:hypothetical protein